MKAALRVEGSSPKDDPLFQGAQIGSLTLRNRLVFPSVASGQAVNGSITPGVLDFYERRAAGGVGMIVTEGMSVHPSSQPHPSVIQAYDPNNKSMLRELSRRVQKYGTSILMQLWHVGRQQLWGPSNTPWGMSPKPDALSGVVPHVMTAEEIQEVVRGYVDCAVIAQDTGFNGIEIHGAHGYLVTQSLSPWSNDRDDEYGGTVARRSRLLIEILDGIRAAVREDFMVALKITGTELVDGGLSVDDTRPLVAELTERGLVDLVTPAQGNFSISLDAHVPDLTFAPAPYRSVINELAAAATPVPTMAVGRITSREMAESYLRTPGIELVGLARPLISDPDLPNKWAGDSDSLVRECVFCNACWENSRAGKGLICINTPSVVERETPKLLPSKAPRTIHVIGGGPAGMETAWVSAARGHTVVLSEKSTELGGQLRKLASLPYLSDYEKILKYQIAQLERYGVRVQLGHPVSTGPRLKDEAGTVLVHATGAQPQSAPAPLVSYPRSFRTPMEPSPEDPGGRLLLIDEDGGWYAYGEVLRHCDTGGNAVIVTPEFSIGTRLGLLGGIRLERMIRERRITVITGHRLARAVDDKLTFTDVTTRRAYDLAAPDDLVYAGPRESSDALWRTVQSSNRSDHLIGDAMAPRDVRAAILQGRELAESL